MKRQKISVIIPVYKTESYLRKCLDSIVGQTYRNLEIILVDDGSPDNSGAICDEYAAKDQRIIVIHQENAGVSAARNAALDVAAGEYIGFVDADDWIEPDMYASLAETMEKNAADIAVCGFMMEWDGGTRLCEQYDKVVSGREVISMLVADNTVVDVIWNKLYRAELWKDLRFPAGRRYEDAAVYHVLMDRAEQVAFLPEVKYHYNLCETGFILTAGFRDMLVRWRVLEDRRTYLRSRYPELAPWLYTDVTAAVMRIWPEAWRCRKEITPHDRNQLSQVARFARENCVFAAGRGEYGISGRLRLWLTRYPRRWAFFACYVLRQLYLWRHPKGDSV